MKTDELVQELEEVTEELISKGGGKAGKVLVVGCSSSEVLGNKIGTGGSLKLAGALVGALQKVCRKHKMILAAQCCEHLNRALVVDQKSHGKIWLAGSDRTASGTRRRRLCHPNVQ